MNDAGYSGWYPGEPNNFKDNEACGSMYVGGKLEAGILNDVPCTEKHHYICEIDSERKITSLESSQNKKWWMFKIKLYFVATNTKFKIKMPTHGAYFQNKAIWIELNCITRISFQGIYVVTPYYLSLSGLDHVR